MHNQNNKYQYCNRDLLNNPEKYNFASFQGKKFLENYLDFRFSIVEKLENSIKLSVTLTELLSNFRIQNISKVNDIELVKSYGHKINETETNDYTDLLEQIKGNFNETN